MERTQRDEALDVLRKVYPKGSTVYTILRSVSRSGATSQVTLMGLGVDTADLVIDQHRQASGATAEVWFPHYAASIITGYRQGTWEGHDTLILPKFHHAYDISARVSQALYGSPDALTHRSI